MELKSTHSRRSSLLLLFILVFLMLISAGQLFAQGTNLIENGGFEAGFDDLEVAEGWGSFRNGKADGSFHDDAWEMVVIEGEHSQMIELVNGHETDAYAGIYQTIEVTPSQKYQLSFKGLVRSDEGSIDESNYGYRLQYAIDLSGNQDWQKVTNWVELPWDEQPRTGPENGSAFKTNSMEQDFTAKGDEVTIFIRAWKKWADRGEGNFNIDAVRVVALEPAAAVETPTPEQPLPTTGDSSTAPVNWVWIAASTALLVFLVGGAVANQRRQTPRVDPDQTRN
jgi:hypothetical protein